MIQLKFYISHVYFLLYISIENYRLTLKILFPELRVFLIMQMVHCNTQADKVQGHEFLLQLVINMNGVHLLKIWNLFFCFKDLIP